MKKIFGVENLRKFLLAVLFLISLVFANASVSGAYIAVSSDGFNLYLSNQSPTPYNDVYYYNKYSVSPNYYGYGYPTYTGYGYPAYSVGGYYANWYGGYYGYVSPVYGYYNYAPSYQYQYYVYQPTPAFCSNYWCYS